MKVHQFDQNGYYYGTIEVVEGEAIPRGTTSVALPKLKKTEEARFIGKEWVVVAKR